MPNVSLQRSFESSCVAIVPLNDGRIQKIVTRLPDAGKLFYGFVDSYGNNVEPSVLIVREDAPSKVKTDVALVAFRNIIGPSCMRTLY